jgi:hypothetical protein
MQSVNREAHDPTELDRRTLELARVGYDAYGGATAWKNVRGEQMPTFQELPHGTLDGWKAAANAIRNALENDETLGSKHIVDRAEAPNDTADSKKKAAIEMLTASGEYNPQEAHDLVDEKGADWILAHGPNHADLVTLRNSKSNAKGKEAAAGHGTSSTRSSR